MLEIVIKYCNSGVIVRYIYLCVSELVLPTSTKRLFKTSFLYLILYTSKERKKDRKKKKKERKFRLNQGMVKLTFDVIDIYKKYVNKKRRTIFNYILYHLTLLLNFLYIRSDVYDTKHNEQQT